MALRARTLKTELMAGTHPSNEELSLGMGKLMANLRTSSKAGREVYSLQFSREYKKDPVEVWY